MNAIYRRRSIRRYTGEPVPYEKLTEFVRAGMNAPSANNGQPWQFVIIDDRRKLDAIPQFHPYSRMLLEAPAAILVCGDTHIATDGDYWVQDCSAATENILLEIADQGYGGVWLGVYPREDRIAGMRKLLNISDHIVPMSLIAVGHPAETKAPKNLFDETRIHRNGF